MQPTLTSTRAATLLATCLVLWAANSQLAAATDLSLVKDGERPDRKIAAVASRIETLVERNFYRKVDFPTLTGDVTAEWIDKALADLGASHTRRIPTGTLDYVEIFDIYSRSLRNEAKRIFSGDIDYEGIGIASIHLGGKAFITDVYPGSAAASTGMIRVGDEVVAVDGKPYDEIGSFQDRAAEAAKLTLRRITDGPVFQVSVKVATIEPTAQFRKATDQSVRIIQHGDRRIGYIRLWTMHDSEVHDAVQQELGKGRLQDCDILILDLRGRWGGYVGRLVDVFAPSGTQVEFIERDGKSSYAPLRWRKPVVGIIDEGSRSAMEILAYTMKKNGARMVGKRTAGAVLGGNAYILPDDSLLMLAGQQVVTDGESLEGKGVAPDIEVDNPLPYAAGADPQFEAAVQAAKALLATE